MIQKDAQKFPPSLIKFLYVLNKKPAEKLKSREINW